MSTQKLSSRLIFAFTAFTLTFAFAAASAFAQQEHTLYRFQGSTDGSTPYSSVIAYHGALYGTTETGGNLSCHYNGCGTVFQMLPPATKGAAWTLNTIYTFQGGADTAAPRGQLAVDNNGNLYGTSYVGGLGSGCQNTYGCGTVFELSPPATEGGAWTETVLHQFQGGSDGAFLEAGVVVDASGNVFGATTVGGNGGCSYNLGCGTVFELSPPAVQGDPWTETILHTFQNGDDGSFPLAALVAGSQGVLYGATNLGGSGCSGCGVAYQLKPPATVGDAWRFSVIYPFNNNGKGVNVGALSFKNGALYATAANTSQTQLGGTLFKLAPSQGGGTWNQTLLLPFSGASGSAGSLPIGQLVFDTKGNIFGVTANGGAGRCNFGCGIVYELSPPSAKGGAWTETVLHEFQKDGNGYYPNGVVLSGNVLYGTTSVAGHHVDGTVFEVIP